MTDVWDRLRLLTPARLGLQRAGPGIGTRDHLAFRAAHALARDAVFSPLDVAGLMTAVQRLGLTALPVRSGCADQATFLSRPDLGRVLAAGEAARLQGETCAVACDVAFVLAGGLSAAAVNAHAVPLLDHVVPRLSGLGWRVGPVAVTQFARVALGDQIGGVLGARFVVVLIGERPGLTAPDSLGAYLTFEPRPGRTDAARNCLSNIRPAGMAVAEGARRLLWLLETADVRGLTGVALKDESDRAVLASPAAAPDQAKLVSHDRPAAGASAAHRPMRSANT
jgi:ethanolamine ammonia-lyase small subunit